MLNFEEFFIKKNIDLTALKADRPALYEEFLDHYEQMGEKSFDHTKKYWFNKLRMDYQLPEPLVIPVSKKEVKPVSAEVPPIEDPSPAVKTSGFKPRFKPGMAKPKKQEDKVVEETDSTATQPIAKPTGFKPRFKANITKSKPAETLDEPTAPSLPEETSRKSEKTHSANKPAGFKPRFKPGITKNKPKDDE